MSCYINEVNNNETYNEKLGFSSRASYPQLDLWPHPPLPHRLFENYKIIHLF